jgi:NAD(P)-dependent dehydrogenase (short-subunit alcohol dehydrogenase family)
MRVEARSEEDGMGLLDGKVAVVTGGGTGIGRAVSLDLAAAGARVVVNDYGVSVDGRDPSSEPANQVVADIRKGGGTALASPESVATMAGGRAVVDLALKEFGDLHIVVCCAGILRERMIFNMSEEEWDAVIAVHLKGHFTVMQPATRHMREKKAGCLIGFTSTAGLEGSPGQPNYSAAKEGIVGLMRSTALAMAKYGVRCNVISPTADTRMTQRLPGERRALSTATPPEAIAPVVTFLASDRAAHITGQIVGVRGPEVTLFSHPAPLRTVTTDARWTGESLAEVWDRTLGQDRLRRFDAMRIPWPPAPA